MPLDDFFAKKEKKKSKKKQNPQELIEKLTKDVEKFKDQEGEASTDVAKPSVNLGDDEWEAIDEEKDIEVQNVRMGNLELAPVEDSTKSVSKEKGDREGNEEPEDNKKVWAAKAPEPKEEEVEEKPQLPPESEQPKKYVPVHLRQDFRSVLAPQKPDVSSATDFPSLDAAVSVETTGKIKLPETKPPNDDDDDVGWSQAGAPQRPRTQDTLPISVSSNPSVYVPPSRRTGSSFAPAPAPAGRFDSRQEHHSPRPRKSMTNRLDGVVAGNRFDGFSARENTGLSLEGWCRGSTVDTPKTFNAGAAGGSLFHAKVPSPSRSLFTNTDYSTDNNAGWTRNVNVKTFKDSARDKQEFELVQTNRFAGLDGSS
ncbi:hypothetical protein FGIG_04011 [Fasciola gigantica]|uniref:Protein CDV3 n=1 Tax=Fasciola gigantica TaxID=46835 RepID=A0A504Y8R3_FASGI|nr:hypothetical protein FGIG_04011 [Fasciola gigantica]